MQNTPSLYSLVAHDIARDFFTLPPKCRNVKYLEKFIQMAIDSVMAPQITLSAQALGSLGGKATKGITSEAKAKASRENGKKGGRPKKKT